MDKEALINLIIIKERKSYVYNKLHFFDYTCDEPKDGYNNVAYVRDINHILLRGKIDDKVCRSMRELERQRLDKCVAIITLSEQMICLIKSIYKLNKDMFVFNTFPQYTQTFPNKIEEIVFIDNSWSSCSFFRYHILNLHNISNICNLPCIFVCREKFFDTALKIKQSYNYKTIIMNEKEYDCSSKYGILLQSFPLLFSKEGVPRKLSRYLMCGMIPIIPIGWDACIDFCKKHDIQPYIYETIDSLEHLKQHDIKQWDRKFFSIEERIEDLIKILNNYVG